MFILFDSVPIVKRFSSCPAYFSCLFLDSFRYLGFFHDSLVFQAISFFYVLQGLSNFFRVASFSQALFTGLFEILTDTPIVIKNRHSDITLYYLLIIIIFRKCIYFFKLL